MLSFGLFSEKYFLALVFFYLSYQITIAQTYSLTNWTVDDGLSCDDIQEILQDRNGMIWLATKHGLNQFDGYRFKKFRHQPGDSSAMGANFINSIIEDEESNIWVNLTVGIVSKYDHLSRRFINYSFPNRNTYVFEIKYIEKVGVLLATNRGLYKYEAETDQLELLILNPIYAQEKVFQIFSHSSGKIYLNTQRGLEVIDLQFRTQKLTSLVRSTDTVSFIYPVVNFFEDQEKKIWIQTKSGAICESEDGFYFTKSLAGSGRTGIQPNGQLFMTEDAQGAKTLFSDDRLLKRFDTKNNSWNTLQPLINQAAFSFIDLEANIWIFSKSHELFKWDGKKWEFVKDLGEKLKYWQVTGIYVDRENGIWFASRGKGVWRLYNRHWPISVVENTNEKDRTLDVTCLQESDHNYLWIGVFQQLYKFFYDSQEIEPFFPRYDVNPLQRKRVNDIIHCKTGDLWIGTNQGIVITDSLGRTYNNVISIDVDKSQFEIGPVRFLFEDDSGNIWIGTNNGLLYYKIKEKQYTLFETNGEKGKSLRNNNVQCIIQVKSNQFLVGYIKEGVDLISLDTVNLVITTQPVNYKNSQPLQFDMMTANVFHYAKNQIWLGTFSKGLLRVDVDRLEMVPINEDFPVIPNITGILDGYNDNLWVCSVDGIRSVNPKDQTFYRFSKASGLTSNQFYMNCAAKGRAGELFYGSPTGLNKIKTSLWSHQDTVVTPILTDFKKYDQSLVVNQSLNDLQLIELDYKDDYITFEFVSPTYDNPLDVQYAYQLVGFDEKWRYCDRSLTATYTNMDPGDYIFKVKAGNKGGFLNSKEKIVHLHISPPFWETSWFFIIVILSLGLLSWAVFRIQWEIRENRLRIINEIRQKTAADFHDELGHRLTKISLFVESLIGQRDQLPINTNRTLVKIQDNANELFNSTRDFIWAMNPSKDSVLDLYILLRDFGDELFEDTSIQFSALDLEKDIREKMLNMDVKRQVVMIFKEAMNNALKHADCSMVSLKFSGDTEQLTISLMDNGKGFVPDKAKFGYGLGSMHTRSKKINADLEIKSIKGKNVEVILKIK